MGYLMAKREAKQHQDEDVDRVEGKKWKICIQYTKRYLKNKFAYIISSTTARPKTGLGSFTACKNTFGDKKFIRYFITICHTVNNSIKFWSSVLGFFLP